MVWEALGNLFEERLRVSTSGGVTATHDVERLSTLAPDEVPPGFPSWVEKRRREYRCGRHHARHALSLAGGAPSPILRDPDGVPLFPPGFRGSITHTGKRVTLAAAAVAPGTCELGIDAEELRELPEDMIEYILSPRERDMLREELRGGSSPMSRVGHAALVAFSAKEAFYKCVFPRIRCRLAFHDVEFRLKSGALKNGQGGFVIRMLRQDVGGAPSELPGRFLHDHDHVLSGVSWQL